MTEKAKEIQADFVELTEVSGEAVSVEQVERLARRYYWAADYCRDMDVAEVACGTGQGAGYLQGLARTFIASDRSSALLAVAKRYYQDQITFLQCDAIAIPLQTNSLDVVLIMEALYYLPDPQQFFAECRRVLRPGGRLLIATANKDLYDFNPSPHSYCYFGVEELKSSLASHEFSVELFGDTPVANVSMRQRLLRPIKAIAAQANLIPKSMTAKKLLKRFVFGRLTTMPPVITDQTAPRQEPKPLTTDRSDQRHKVLFCAARSKS